MGKSIAQDTFKKQDFEQFNLKLRDNLEALKQILADPSFGTGPSSLGAELEFYLIDDNGNPSPCNQPVLQAAHNPQLTLELNRFNLEYNFCPYPFSGKPFKLFEQELQQMTAALRPAVQANACELLPIGILPTLQTRHFNKHTMSDLPRYRTMDQALRQLRGEAFHIDIDGNPPLLLDWRDVTLEGANTSFQIHWRINPADFTDCFNAIQLVTPIVLALSANSPYLFGHQLWQETRIPLFKQSIDCRHQAQHHRNAYPPRVYFGHGWLREGIWELFAATVALFPPIMPVLDEEDPLAMLKKGELPHLHELQLHQGSTWPWNRAIYDSHHGGHIRIEARALPAGPTMADMSANAAFLIGCALALKDSMPDRINLLPFRCAEKNFFRAAKEGLATTLLWPSSSQIQVVEYPLTELANRLIPLAHTALVDAGMQQEECLRLMDIIQNRLDAGINGALWQQSITGQFTGQGYTLNKALRHMLQQYHRHYQTGKPLSQWSTKI